MKKKQIFLLSLFVIVGTLFFYSCAIKVTLMNPSPNINMNVSKSKLYLEIDENIKDTFDIPQSNGIKKAHVYSWRTSLNNGFKNAFGGYFEITNVKNDADFILLLKKTNIEFVPSSYKTVTSGYSSSTSVNSVVAHITYNASLLNSKGEFIKGSANTCISKKSVTSAKSCTDAVSSAVESMYESIANEVFTKKE